MYRILIQRATRQAYTPSAAQFRFWAKRALNDKMPAAELTIRVVNETEITQLNSTYRHKHKPTNVLSFPFQKPQGVEMEIPLLGDIIICAQVVNEEAKAQAKAPEAHWAHMVIHGVLHLLGYDHEIEAEANRMEAEETRILQSLNYPNPYH